MREITFEGGTVPIMPGQSIGAALMAAGIRSWRTTRVRGRPRGLFCGIGVCFDCLVSVGGRPPVRACATEARPGDVVTAVSDGHGQDRRGADAREAGTASDEDRPRGRRSEQSKTGPDDET